MVRFLSCLVTVLSVVVRLVSVLLSELSVVLVLLCLSSVCNVLCTGRFLIVRWKVPVWVLTV